MVVEMYFNLFGYIYGICIKDINNMIKVKLNMNRSE